MIKRTLLFMAMLLVIAYLIIATTVFNDKPVERVCHKMEFAIKDTNNSILITKDEIIELLKQKSQYPVGKKIGNIQSKTIEKILCSHPLIGNAECYKTAGDKIFIEINQRIPVLRIMSNNGDNYYIDHKGKIIPPGTNCLVHLAIATGDIKKSFAIKELSHFGSFLQNDPFWRSQIQQVNVIQGNEIELVPRVGDHLIFLGKLDHFEEKLKKLKIFYEKALNQVGWNKYTRISMEFGNQIICTKKEN